MSLITLQGYRKSTVGTAVASQLTNGAINTAALGGVDVRFSVIPDAFWVNGSGNLDLLMLDGQELSFTVAPADSLVPVRAQAIKSTSSCGTVIALIS